MLTNPMPPLLPLSEFLPLMAMRFRERRASRAARKFLRLPTPHPRPWWPTTPLLSMRLHRAMLQSFRMEHAEFSRLCPSLGTRLQLTQEQHQQKLGRAMRVALLEGKPPVNLADHLPAFRSESSRAPTR